MVQLARRRRRPRRRHPHGAQGLGGERPPRDVHRPARRLPQLQGALPGRPAAGVGRVPELRGQGLVHRGPQLQPDVQDLRRPGRGRRRRRLPAARDGAGHLRQLRERADDRAQEAAVRHRADRQVVPQRDHARQLHLPHARVRADGDGVLRPARGRATAGTSTGARSASAGTSTSASPRRSCACARTTPRSCRTTRAGTSDVEFDYPWGWGELEGIANRTDFDLTPARRSSPARTSPTSTRRHDRRYVPYVIEPAAGADRATLAFLLAAYDEDEAPTADGKVEKRTVLRLDPRLAPIKVAVLPLSKNEKLVPGRRRGRGALRPHFMIDVDVAGVDRPPLPAPGRGRHAVVRHRRLRHARRPGGDRPRPRHDGTGPGPDRRPGRPSERTVPVVDRRPHPLRHPRASSPTRDEERDQARVPGAARGRATAPATTRRALRIRRAWQVLSDPVQRSRYDDSVGVTARRPPRRRPRRTGRRRPGDAVDGRRPADDVDDRRRRATTAPATQPVDDVDWRAPAPPAAGRRRRPPPPMAEGLELPTMGRRLAGDAHRRDHARSRSGSGSTSSPRSVSGGAGFAIFVGGLPCSLVLPVRRPARRTATRADARQADDLHDGRRPPRAVSC